jgi:hypothetical protein
VNVTQVQRDNQGDGRTPIHIMHTNPDRMQTTAIDARTTYSQRGCSRQKCDRDPAAINSGHDS